MIKNKAFNIKIIFKIYFKIFLVSKQIFILQNIIKQISKTIFNNYFSKLFLKTIIKYDPNYLLIRMKKKYENNSFGLIWYFFKTSISNPFSIKLKFL